MGTLAHTTPEVEMWLECQRIGTSVDGNSSVGTSLITDRMIFLMCKTVD